MARYTVTGQYPTTRRDYAASKFYNAVYDEIRANAGLDTQWGHDAARYALTICDMILKGVDIGFSSYVEVGPYRDTVTVERIA